jgi:hypothetical protein
LNYEWISSCPGPCNHLNTTDTRRRDSSSALLPFWILDFRF